MRARTQAWLTAVVAGWLSPGIVAAADLDAGGLQQLTASYDEAMANAGDGGQLDAAYELLAVVESATAAGGTELAARASDGLIGLVNRAGRAANDLPAAAAQDSIDQLLDLKFSAGSSGLDRILAAIDSAMMPLIGRAHDGLSAVIKGDEDFETRLNALAALGDLEASSAQANLTDAATTIGRSFDEGFSAVSEDAHSVDGVDRIAALEAVRATRDERLTDAVTNNVKSVAEEIRAAELTGDPSAEEAEADGLGEDYEAFVESATCTETGTAGPAPGPLTDALTRACVLSGNTTASARCPTRDLSFVCYRKDAAAESIVYVYRNTPEEEMMRFDCAEADMLDSSLIPEAGAPFRGDGVTLALTCAPLGQRADKE